MSARSTTPYKDPSTYLAIHQTPFKKHGQGQDIQVLSVSQADERITGLIHTHTQRLQYLETVSSKAGGRKGGWAHAYSLLPPAATLCIGFGMVLVNTISSWGTQTLLHNVGQVCGLSAMAIAGVNAGLTYRTHQKEIEMTKQASEREKIENEKNMRLQFALDQLEFLKGSAQMAAICLEEHPKPKQLSMKFLEFNLFMTGLKAGVVPNDLIVKWEEIGDIIESAPDDPRRDSLSERVQRKILPRISYYTANIQDVLVSLDYAEAPLETERGDEENPLISDMDLRGYGSIQEEAKKTSSISESTTK
jgi:hypothetical protein